MRSQSSKSAAALAAAALVLTATACAGGGSTPAASATSPSATPVPTVTGPVTITYDEVDSSGTLKTTLAGIVASFEKANPDITVTLDPYANYGALQTADTAKLASHTAPTVAQAYESWAATYSSDGSILPISALAGTDKPAQLSTFYSGVQKDLYLPDGKLWMWPASKSVQVFFYNQNLYSQDKLTVPTTWADFATDAKAASVDGVTAMTVDPTADGETLLETLATANSGAVYDSKGDPQFTSPAVVAAGQYIQSLKNSGALKVGAVGTYPGETAMGAQKGMFDLSSVAGYYYEQSAAGGKFTVGAFPMPAGSASSATFMAGANEVVFSSATEQQRAAAWAFLQYLASAPVQATWAAGTGYLPVTAAALTAPALSSFVAKNSYETAAANSLNSAFTDPAYQWVTACGTDLGVAMQAILDNNTAPATALATAQSSCQSTQSADQ
jgi:multiple sugar transport system substrate-binding protein